MTMIIKKTNLNKLSNFGKDNSFLSIVERKKPSNSDLFFKEIRESYGMSHIYKRSSVDQSYKILKQNQILILASDQDAKDKGVIVNFFNHKTSVPKGAALFHLKTGAALIFSVSTNTSALFLSAHFLLKPC